MTGLGLLALATLSGLALLSIRRPARPRWTAGQLREALAAQGLAVDAAAPRWRALGRTAARAWVGGRRVEVRVERDLLTPEPRVVVHLEAPLDASLRLQIHFAGQTWWVLGDEALAAALASARVRAATRPGDQLHLGDGGLTLLADGPERAGEAAAALAELADRVGGRSGPGILEALLEETAFADTDPRARAEAMGFLLQRRPELAARATADSAPEVRLAVARAAGGRLGFDLAAEVLTSEIFHRDLQQAALRHLVGCHEPERVAPVLLGAMGGADDGLLGALVTNLVAVAERMRAPRGSSAASALARVVEALHAALPTAELGNAARIAEALGRLEGAASEPTLLALLARLPVAGPVLPDEEELAASVADALGRVGSKACLPSLRALAATVRPDGAVGIATKVALDLVRTRVDGGGLRGALALVGDPDREGRLSAAPVDRPGLEPSRPLG